MNIQRIKCGNGNCYIIEEDGMAVLVDTARTKFRDKILAACHRTNIQLILLTHTHVDHCQNAAYLAQQLQVSIAICEGDLQLIEDNMLQPLQARTLLGKLVLALSEQAFQHDVIPQFKPSVFLKEGDTLEEYGIHAKIIELPGHTNGSIGVDLGENGVVVGDALMNMVYPTVSMLYHNHEQMLASAEKISRLGKRTIYYGHGKPTINRKWS